MKTENWKKGKAESAMIEYEKKKMKEAKEAFQKRKEEEDTNKKDE